MFGQFAFEGVAVDDEPEDVEPAVEPVVALDDVGVFVVVVLVAAWAATPPPRMSAPVMAVAATAFRMGCILITSFPLGGSSPIQEGQPEDRLRGAREPAVTCDGA